MLDALQSAGRQRAITAWHQGLAQWLRPLLAIALISQWHPSSVVALVGSIGAAAFTHPSGERDLPSAGPLWIGVRWCFRRDSDNTARKN